MYEGVGRGSRPEGSGMTPSIGRIVHASKEANHEGHPHWLAAIITEVHTERCVSVTLFPFNEPPEPLTSLELLEEGEDAGQNPTLRWRWPPRV